ncbi:MAG: hypothetical protein PHE15_03385 [Dehalococcoidales bacterium]|nr:hypothetical protein [Dehalococcoidales bacterium]
MFAEEAQRVGEVTRSGIMDFTAQCYELDQFPPLGGLVKTRNAESEIYALVFQATTDGVEPGRRPVARGKNENSEEAIYKSSPQLQKLLKSEFGALVVGHKTNNKIFHYLPSRPARIHSFVYLCPAQEVKEFSQSFAFLNTLLNNTLPLPREELIAASLRQMSQVQEDKHYFFILAGKHLATLLSGDFNQLKAILERIRQ